MPSNKLLNHTPSCRIPEGPISPICSGWYPRWAEPHPATALPIPRQGAGALCLRRANALPSSSTVHAAHVAWILYLLLGSTGEGEQEPLEPSPCQAKVRGAKL